jgi:hypothetical protein
MRKNVRSTMSHRCIVMVIEFVCVEGTVYRDGGVTRSVYCPAPAPKKKKVPADIVVGPN